MVGILDRFLLGWMAHFQGQAVSFREGKPHGLVYLLYFDKG